MIMLASAGVDIRTLIDAWEETVFEVPRYAAIVAEGSMPLPDTTLPSKSMPPIFYVSVMI